MRKLTEMSRPSPKEIVLYTTFQADYYGVSSGGSRNNVACTAGAVIYLFDLVRWLGIRTIL